MYMSDSPHIGLKSFVFEEIYNTIINSVMKYKTLYCV